MKMDGQGRFKAQVSIGNGTIPIEGAVVIVRSDNEENTAIAHFLVTDRDGLTSTIELPAPNTGYSLTPSVTKLPFSKYFVEVVAPGFLKQSVEVAIFDQNTAYQEINLLPLE